MPVAASIALKAASTGPSPAALRSTLRPSVCCRRTSARAGLLLRASVASSMRVQGPLAEPSARSTSASMSPSNNSFFLSASALNSSNTRLNSSSSSSNPSALHRERADALAERVPAAVLAEHQVAARQAHVLGTQDLVGRVVLEHSVLVNAGFVREGVFTHHRLVARDRHAGDAGNEPRGGVQAAGVNGGADVEERG